MTEPLLLRAPEEDGAVVIQPPLAEVGTLLAANRQRLDRQVSFIPGLSFTEVREQARQAAVKAAQEYLRSSGEPVPESASLSLIMAGHQPELFHPGVWIKNFALYGLARRHGLTPISLIVDNDTAKSTSLHVPAHKDGGDTEDDEDVHDLRDRRKECRVALQNVRFDEWAGDGPYEERSVHNEEMFASFADHAGSWLRGWNYEPFLDEFWAVVKHQSKRTPLLGERFASSRRIIERRWGCHNLELPVSLVCQTEPFARFACHILSDLPRFHAIYNDCVHDYRRRHGLRSRNHPVPDLATEGDWLEAPFWVWRTGQAKRSRLFVKRGPDRLLLRAGSTAWPSLPLTNCDSRRADAAPLACQKLAGSWLELQQTGYKIRSRALTNTLFARVFLADLFIHGIGGGKYDQVTDQIIRRFYGLEPPAYMVLSGTLLLPLATFPVKREDHGRLMQMVRDLYYNPQRHLDDALDEALAEQVAAKLDWMAREPDNHEDHLTRFRALRAINDSLRPLLTERIEHGKDELARHDQALHDNAILTRRDYAFCLYPERKIREFVTPFLTIAQPRVT